MGYSLSTTPICPNICENFCKGTTFIRTTKFSAYFFLRNREKREFLNII